MANSKIIRNFASSNLKQEIIMVQLNNSDNYEHLCNVVLTKDKFPIAYENKVKELIDECHVSREEAENIVNNMEIELEVYYEVGYGLFAIESDAVESATIYSPYSGELCKEPKL